jgi:hypothetical protein
MTELCTAFAASANINSYKETKELALRCLVRWYSQFLKSSRQEPPITLDAVEEQMDSFRDYVWTADKKLFQFASANELWQLAYFAWKNIYLPKKLRMLDD